MNDLTLIQLQAFTYSIIRKKNNYQTKIIYPNLQYNVHKFIKYRKKMHKTHQLFATVMHGIHIKKSTIEQFIYLKPTLTFESIEII